jgi:hypothetical protein
MHAGAPREPLPPCWSIQQISPLPLHWVMHVSRGAWQLETQQWGLTT